MAVDWNKVGGTPLIPAGAVRPNLDDPPWERPSVEPALSHMAGMTWGRGVDLALACPRGVVMSTPLAGGRRGAVATLSTPRGKLVSTRVGLAAKGVPWIGSTDPQLLFLTDWPTLLVWLPWEVSNRTGQDVGSCFIGNLDGKSKWPGHDGGLPEADDVVVLCSPQAAYGWARSLKAGGMGECRMMVVPRPPGADGAWAAARGAMSHGGKVVDVLAGRVRKW